MRFDNKIAVVTGSASGIGRATALSLAAEGAIVYAADKDAERNARLAEEANDSTDSTDSKGTIRPQACDVCKVADIEALMNRVAQEAGGIDILFNNAGAGGARPPIDEISPAEWDATMDLLLRSVAMGIRYAVPHMKGRTGAAIVNTASVAATGPGYSPTAYAVAKGGVLHLTKLAAADLARYHIRVNAVCPGLINTDIFTESLGVDGAKAEQIKAVLAQHSQTAQPIARGGLPQDIANAVLFLASEQSAFMTGSHLMVDGGLTIGPRYSWDPEKSTIFDAVDKIARSLPDTTAPTDTASA